MNMCFLKINMFRFCLFENTKYFSKSLPKSFLLWTPQKCFSNVDLTEKTSQLSVALEVFANQKKRTVIQMFNKHGLYFFY